MEDLVIHKSRGACKIWCDFGTHLTLIDANNQRFTSTRGELIGQEIEASFVAVAVPLKEVTINDKNLTAEQLSDNLILDLEFATAMVKNRPLNGYTGMANLEDIMAINGYPIDVPTITKIKPFLNFEVFK